MFGGNDSEYSGNFYMGYITNEKEMLNIVSISDISLPLALFKY